MHGLGMFLFQCSKFFLEVCQTFYRISIGNEFTAAIPELGLGGLEDGMVDVRQVIRY